MEFAQIIYAVTLAEYLNFSRAAAKLFITQPTLSQQIRRLESDLGFPLFRRNTKKVELTEAGEVFINEARDLVSSYWHLENTCNEISSAYKDKVSFGISIIQLPYITKDIILFKELFPDVRLSVINGWAEELKQMLIDDIINVALLVIAGNDELNKFQKTVIREAYICASVSKNHRLVGQKSISLKDIYNERLILSDERSGLSAQILREFTKVNLKPQKVMHAGMFEMRVPILIKENAVTFTLHDRVEWCEGANIINIPIEPRIYATYAICTKLGISPSLPIRSLISILKQNQSST